MFCTKGLFKSIINCGITRACVVRERIGEITIHTTPANHARVMAHLKYLPPHLKINVKTVPVQMFNITWSYSMIDLTQGAYFVVSPHTSTGAFKGRWPFHTIRSEAMIRYTAPIIQKLVKEALKCPGLIRK